MGPLGSTNNYIYSTWPCCDVVIWKIFNTINDNPWKTCPKEGLCYDKKMTMVLLLINDRKKVSASNSSLAKEMHLPLPPVQLERVEDAA